MKGEGGVGVVEVADPHVIHRLGVMQLLQMGIVRQPLRVPVVDAVEIASVVEAIGACWDGSKILGHEHAQCGDTLQMDGVVVVVRSVIIKKTGR